MAFLRVDLADLNKNAGITSLPLHHYDCKRGKIYGDRMYRHKLEYQQGLQASMERYGCRSTSVLEKQTLRNLRAYSFSTFTRNIPC